MRSACEPFQNALGNPGRILFALLLLLATEAGADPWVELMAEADRQELSHDPTWLRLLCYDRGSDRSAMLADEFFLSEHGRTDPRAELMATLRAYYEDDEGVGDDSIQCRFPARYYWLSSKLDLDGYELRRPECRKLENWALLDQTRSVSLLLVAGYLGNPASTFGHSLVKLNSDAADDRGGLFDLTLNFGALIPQNENPILYIFRGLSGRYEAGFSDRYFYSQDLVYSRTEFRDIWDYELNLSEFQRTLLILHLFEIVGKKFKYYFLDKNCGYRIAELLQLVVDEEVLGDVGRWYAPVELFHRLAEIDESRAVAGEGALVRSVEYVPSSRRKLHHKLKLLDGEEMDAVNRFVDEGGESLGALIEPFPEERQTVLLDGLLAYQQYRITVDQPDSLDVAWQRKREILVARLGLPPRQRAEAPIAELRSPAAGFRPAEWTLAAGAESGDFQYGLLAWSPFKKESVGYNSLEGDELAFVDLSLGVADDSPAVFLNRLDLIRILSLNPPWARIRGERGLSWKLRVGVDRVRIDGHHDYDGVFSFGVGRAWRWGREILPFGLFHAEAHTDSPYARLTPEIGLILGLSRLRARVAFGMQSNDYSGDFRRRWAGKLLFRLNSRLSAHAEFSDDETRRTVFGLSRYF